MVGGTELAKMILQLPRSKAMFANGLGMVSAPLTTKN